MSPIDPIACGAAETLAKMQAAIKTGDFHIATEVGNAGPVPLAVSKGELGIRDAIAKGAESTVFRGTYKGQAVAVKKVCIGTNADHERFRRELTLLSGMDHPNVVKLLCARAMPPDHMLVMPLAPTNLETEIHHAGWRPGWKTTARVALGLAEALAAVHAKRVCHRDMKPGNVLLTEDCSPVLTDFGIADTLEGIAGYNRLGEKPSGGFLKRKIVGTLEYMAPEVLKRGEHSFGSDAWAWAVTANELASGTFPYSDCTRDNPKAHTVLEMGYGRIELAAAIAAEGLRPLIPDTAPPAWTALMNACWSLDPAARPAMAEVVDVMRALLESATDESPAAMEVDDADAGADPAASCTGMMPSTREEGDWPSPSWAGVASGSLPVTAGAYATCGARGEDKMEDRHLMVEGLGGHACTHLLAVYDGHRGARAAEFAVNNLERAIRDTWSEPSPESTMRGAFLGLESAFAASEDALHAARVARMGAGAAGARAYPGATALAALLWRDAIVVANAGDCRAVLCRGGDPVALSNDHTADVAAERERILATGGTVEWRVNGYRVGSAGIAVSRSLGDLDLKREGLSAEPEVTVTPLTAADEFVVLASDGLFDRLSNEEVIGLVHDTVKEPSLCAKRLVTEALTRGSLDNITAVVAFLQPVSTLEEIYAGGRQKYKITPTMYGSRRAMMEAYATGQAGDELRDTY